MKDQEGRQAQTKVYNIDYPGGYFSINDILIPPTIDLVRPMVVKGNFLEVFGYASVRNNVKIEIDNDLVYETGADNNGNYHLLIDTDNFSLGRHSIRAKQQYSSTKQESDFSPIRNFSIYISKATKVDFNSDGKVDIEDWSIFLSRWKTEDQDERNTIDLNNDGKINIGDLSIFLQLFKN